MNDSRKRLAAGDHPKKEMKKVLKAILEREDPSWELTAGGHWGTLWCSNDCCQIPVGGSPRVPSRAARDLQREVDKCPREDGDVRKRQSRRED